MMSNKALTTQKGTVNRGLIHLHLQKLLNMWLIFYKKNVCIMVKNFLSGEFFTAFLKIPSRKRKCLPTSLTRLANSFQEAATRGLL